MDTGEVKLSGKAVRDLVSFLESSTVPDLHARLELLIPESVPSGLLEDGIPEVP